MICQIVSWFLQSILLKFKNNFVEAFRGATFMVSFFVPDHQPGQIMNKQGLEKAGQILFIKCR
jgi:hypothetical protein